LLLWPSEIETRETEFGETVEDEGRKAVLVWNKNGGF